MQSALSRIWTQVPVSISYDHKHYTIYESLISMHTKFSSSISNNLGEYIGCLNIRGTLIANNSTTNSCILICRCRRKHKDAIKTSGHSSLEKYTSHFIRKGSKGLRRVLLCVRWVGDWTEPQHIDPHSYGHNSVSFPFSWAAQPGAWGPSFCSHSSIFSPTDLNFLSPGLYNNLTPTYFLWASQFALNSTPRQSRSTPDIFDRMHLLFTQVHFLFWQLGRVGGQYTT